MRYVCTNCNYVFDSALGDNEESVQIGIQLDKCPVCEEFDTFQGIEEEVNYIDENDDLDDIEAEHFPDINISGGVLEVIIGDHDHPMGEEHRIASVSLYDEDGELIEEKFMHEEPVSSTEFEFDDLDEFEIRVKCSTHGVWGKKFHN